MLNTSINNCALDNIKHKMLSECPVRYHGMALIEYQIIGLGLGLGLIDTVLVLLFWSCDMSVFFQIFSKCEVN